MTDTMALLNARITCMLLTDTPILCLPGKKVEQGCQRLADQSKADPKYAIANYLPIFALHVLEW